MPFRPVYSAPFILYTDDTPNTEFEVPAGFTAIVREVIVYSQLGEDVVSIGFYQPGSEYRVVFYGSETYAVNTSNPWSGRVVIDEGGLIEMQITDVSTYSSVYVGGYLLTNTYT